MCIYVYIHTTRRPTHSCFVCILQWFGGKKWLACNTPYFNYYWFLRICFLKKSVNFLFKLGASGLHLTKHENFHGGLDAISVGDGLFTILTTLSKKASTVHMMLQPILTYMACGYMGRQVSSIQQQLQ